jgi:hypothetical protein
LASTEKKEVSFSELEALPTVKDEQDVEEIIEFLVSHFDAEKLTLKTSSWPILSWETVVKLKTLLKPCLTTIVLKLQLKTPRIWAHAKLCPYFFVDNA